MIKPVREWDVGKKEAGGQDRSRERDRGTERSKERRGSGGRDDRKRSSDREFGRDRDRKRSRSGSPGNCAFVMGFTDCIFNHNTMCFFIFRTKVQKGGRSTDQTA